MVLIMTSTTTTTIGSVKGLSWKRSPKGREMHWSTPSNNAATSATNRDTASDTKTCSPCQSSMQALVSLPTERPTSPSCVRTPFLLCARACTTEISISQLWYSLGDDARGSQSLMPCGPIEADYGSPKAAQIARACRHTWARQGADKILTLPCSCFHKQSYTTKLRYIDWTESEMVA